MERPNAFVFAGPRTLVGPVLKVGDTAPSFKVVDNGLQEVNSATYAGKVRIINSVPSLETGACDAQTRRFNEEASSLGENVVILTISMDLPFTQKKWCAAAGVERVATLSDHKYASFSNAYGTFVKELRLCSRAVFVVDAQDKVVHVEYVGSGPEQPNYEAALEAAKAAR